MVVKNCQDCGEVEHKEFGLMPKEAFEEPKEEGGVWERVFGCKECGRFIFEGPSEEEVQDSIDEIIDFMVENKLMDEQVAEDIKSKR